ncbi:MAG: cell division protein FtsQ/DivIB, partial [Candidatus Marinimicrobia bacterium]|nr:cell division protein FtsQ/DivIB [Candidatus Neomarinimicrobiota bacterium]
PLYNIISEIHIGVRGDVNLIGTKNSTLVYLGKSDFVNKIDRIRSLVATINQGEGLSGYQYVDLRFKNQVIVKERS